MVAVSNRALISSNGDSGMLRVWVDGVKHAGVKNALVVALDDQTAVAMARLEIPFWRKAGRGGQGINLHRVSHPLHAPPQDPKDLVGLADRAASNHGISALKFQLIKQFLVLGYHVLLSDVDVLTVQNPFKFL